MICKLCEAKFEEPYQLASHKKKHRTGTLKCPVDDNCKQTFKHRGDQKRHCRYAHHTTKDFLCDNCGKAFQSPQSRAPHLKNCK